MKTKDYPVTECPSADMPRLDVTRGPYAHLQSHLWRRNGFITLKSKVTPDFKEERDRLMRK